MYRQILLQNENFEKCTNKFIKKLKFSKIVLKTLSINTIFKKTSVRISFKKMKLQKNVLSFKKN